MINRLPRLPRLNCPVWLYSDSRLAAWLYRAGYTGAAWRLAALLDRSLLARVPASEFLPPTDNILSVMIAAAGLAANGHISTGDAEAVHIAAQKLLEGRSDA